MRLMPSVVDSPTPDAGLVFYALIISSAILKLSEMNTQNIFDRSFP
jgi:hypothetical protein